MTPKPKRTDLSVVPSTRLNVSIPKGAMDGDSPERFALRTRHLTPFLPDQAPLVSKLFLLDGDFAMNFLFNDPPLWSFPLILFGVAGLSFIVAGWMLAP